MVFPLFEFCEPDSCLHAPAWQMWSVNRYGTHSARMRIAPSASCEARRLFHGPKYSKSRDPSGTIDWKDEVWCIMVAFSALLAFYEGIRRIPMYSHRKGREMRSIDVFQVVEKKQSSCRSFETLPCDVTIMVSQESIAWKFLYHLDHYREKKDAKIITSVGNIPTDRGN